MTVARAIVNGTSDPAVLLDPKLVALECNVRFAELTGLRRRALESKLGEGNTPLSLLGGSIAMEREHAELALRGKKPIQLAEVVLKNPTGEELVVNIAFIPVLDPAGEAVGLIELLRDVSGEARVQTRYRELLHAERLRAEHLEREVEKRTRELTAALEEVTRLSREDPLTGMLNRRAFTDLATQALKMARRHRRAVGLLVADLDHFKQVNDTYGHQAGDAVLAATAKTLIAEVRDTDCLARFGGEEFVVLLSETQAESVSATGDRLRAAIERLNTTRPVEGVKFPTVSIGMAVFPDHGETLDALVSCADAALYQAKDAGRNRALMYDKGTQRGAPVPRGDLRQRVLVVDGSTVAAQRYHEALAATYDVVPAATTRDALELCQRERFHVIVADLSDIDEGVEVLRQSLRLRPEALRVLVIDTEDVFVEVRGTNVARVDCFLLRHEGPIHIVEAIDNALARREHDRQRTMLDNEDVRKLFTTRLSELDALIENRQVSFAYQPIVDPKSGEVRAYEALCRAQHPLFKNATVLFEAAVQSGNLWRLGRLCREIALKALVDLPPAVQLFINLHPGEIDDPELLGWAGNGPDPSRVVFEITERAAIPDFRRFRNTARALGARGFRFAIDDLGAGYASLNAVALLEPSFVKIDMTMIRGLDRSERKKRLIHRMIEFANDVGISLIAEGVETSAEAAILRELGCHLAQGYYFGRPLERGGKK